MELSPPSSLRQAFSIEKFLFVGSCLVRTRKDGPGQQKRLIEFQPAIFRRHPPNGSCELSGTGVVAGRKAIGYVIILLGSLLGLVVPIIHMKGAGVGGAIAKSSGAFFFIWTLLALGVTALFSVILSGARTVGAFAMADRRRRHSKVHVHEAAIRK